MRIAPRRTLQIIVAAGLIGTAAAANVGRTSPYLPSNGTADSGSLPTGVTLQAIDGDSQTMFTYAANGTCIARLDQFRIISAFEPQFRRVLSRLL